MAQQTYVFNPPVAANFPLIIYPRGVTEMKTIEVDNGSALTLTVLGDNQVIRAVAPYTSRFNLNTGGSWEQIIITANAASIANTDAVTIIVYDDVLVPPLLPAFGPSAWGGGAAASTLRPINPGDQFLAWQVQQFMDLLTGVMTGQAVTIKNNLMTTELIIGTGAGNQKILTVSSDLLSIFAQDAATELWRLDDSGNLTSIAAKRISSNGVGVSIKALLNDVPIKTAQLITNFTPAGSLAYGLQTLSGLPASAVEATIAITMPGTSTDRLAIAADNLGNVQGGIVADVSTGSCTLQVTCTVLTASQLAFAWVGATTHAIQVYVISYREPS